MTQPPDFSPASFKLRQQAEVSLRLRGLKLRTSPARPRSESDAARTLHELEVHQIELEMQNAELQIVRDDLEEALEKFTDLYDFAPVGYFSLGTKGEILGANLTGATMLGVERSRLIKRSLPLLMPPANRAGFLSFLHKVFAGPRGQSCETPLLKADGTTFWAGFHAVSAVCEKKAPKWCRVAFMDVSLRKQAEAWERHLETMTSTNRDLNLEIARREQVELALRTTERDLNMSLRHSREMQAELKELSHQILHVQEEERKRISRELHDEIAQTLVGINVHLAGLANESLGKHGDFQKKITRTRRVVEKSVDIVHRFARELRPTVLDDLGLIPALHAFLKDFTQRTGVRTQLTSFAAVEQLSIARRTVLYRVAYEALNNVAQHAGASRVTVGIEARENQVCMTIQDNGKSFSLEKTLRGKRLGLLGMRERLEMVGGSFAVESAPGQGTSIKAQIPLAKTSARAKPSH